MASPQILQLWREDPHRAGVSVKCDARETKRSINTLNHSINKSKCHDLMSGLVCSPLAQTLWAGFIHLIQLNDSR